MKKNDSKRNDSNRKKLIISVVVLIMAIIAVIFATYTWFLNQRKLTTATWIKTPIVLSIGSGKNHDIKYMDMGDIDVEDGTSKDYVICVYGTPVDNYSLQLAYTTNIAFHYDVYRASEATRTSDGAVESTYVDASGNTQTEYFTIADTTPVISGKNLNEIKKDASDSASAHQSHSLSYGDDEGENAISTEKVQSNAEPLYWLAEENGTNVLKPKNTGTTADGTDYFLDYFIIRVSWDADEVSNDKETDIVYLTVSR
jgi:hypothetical protein